MIEALFLIPAGILAGFLWLEQRRSDKLRALHTATLDEWTADRTKLLEQLEAARKDRQAEIATERAGLAAERQEWSKERAQLLNRIQRPETAVYESFEPSNIQGHVPFDDDEAAWDAMARVNGD